MRLTVLAIGKARAGPEQMLVSDYLDRAARTGRGLGLAGVELRELDVKGATGPQTEADALRRATPEGALLVCLDERGKLLTSTEFAQKLAAWRDDGTKHVAFAIGGADGLDRALVREAALSLSFGPMVWPHMLARVMIAEQLYRAASILAGTPYHRA